jgi:NAD(P)-dependent dehydrogenase (short-subunit alcohol dehydrogenase family)
MEMELKGKTTIITGSGRGIGRALALEFSREGANVVCCARSEKEIRETVALLEKEGGHGIAIQMDVTQKEQVAKMVNEVWGRFGQIDVLFNNAGSFQAIGGVWEVDAELWWHDVTVNLRGAMLCCQAVLPHMMERNEGVIINMSGGGFAGPFPGGSGYASSKAALMRLTDSLAQELERVGSSVLVFGTGPGLVRTKMTEYQVETPEGRKWIPFVKEKFDQRQDRPPEDCAKATVELIRIARPDLNGRIFDVEMDFAKVAKRASEIKDRDLFVIRFRSWDK